MRTKIILSPQPAWGEFRGKISPTKRRLPQNNGGMTMKHVRLFSIAVTMLLVAVLLKANAHLNDQELCKSGQEAQKKERVVEELKNIWGEKNRFRSEKLINIAAELQSLG